MNIQIIVGSVREGRTAIKVAHWVQQAIKSYNFSTVQTELVDLKEWNLPPVCRSESAAKRYL